MSKYTEAELKDACLVWLKYYISASTLEIGPVVLSEDFDEWWAERNKPAKKIIDLSPLIASGIDCEFWNHTVLIPHRVINGLGQIGRSPINSPQYYTSLHCHPWDKCRPRMNHILFHNGGECPLPEGFKLRIYFRGSAVLDKHLYLDCKWLHTDTHFSDVIGYEILGLADGYAYPWEYQE